MHFRTRYRIQTVPFVIVMLCVALAISVITIRKFAEFLELQMSALPAIATGVAALGPLMFAVWYFSSYCEVRRGELRMRWMWRKQEVNLRQLESVEVYGVGRRKLILHLADTDGSDLYLPLNTWRDEDLIMARVLRATVDCKQRIDGEPETVKDFSGLLETYKSWDRRLTTAA